jgi:ABC-type antimicrobial peptide transport system permease subunit
MFARRASLVTPTTPLLFRPLNQPSTFFVTFRESAGTRQVLEQVIHAFDPRLTLTTESVSAQVLDALDNSIFGASVASGLGMLAMWLSIVGVFGVTAFTVEERRRELGIRLALGARRMDIRHTLIGAARWPLAGGLVTGLGLSVLGGFLLRSFLIEVSPLDPASYALVAGLMMCAAGLATWLPMRRAVRVDPAVTLRAESPLTIFRSCR